MSGVLLGFRVLSKTRLTEGLIGTYRQYRVPLRAVGLGVYTVGQSRLRLEFQAIP